ncbi:MAG TPA: hypothetical protein DEP85_02820 [Holosporales bacterium]|nr:hypothetical protein [Holosporales bacterium]
MGNKKPGLLDEVYSTHLQQINAIKFTRREIDVIAFFVCGRAAKKIAGFFSISPKTVENHVHNIMVKLGCNSREGIIDFIEKSDKLSILRKYYAIALIQAAFEATLKKITKLTEGEKTSCVILTDAGHTCDVYTILCLESSLSYAGVKVSREKITTLESIETFCKVKCGILLRAPQTHEGLGKERFYFIPKGENTLLELQYRVGSTSSLELAVQKEYYLFVFDLLKRIFPQADFKQLIEEFLKHSEGVESHQTLSGGYEKTELQKREPLSNFQKNWRHLYIGFVVLLFLGGAAVLNYALKGKNSASDQKAAYSNSQEKNTRSDIDVPTDAVLLNRPELLDQIKKRFNLQKRGIQSVALVGIGGAGKTTLARQYAYSQKVPVLWEINAEGKESLQTSFESLAEALGKSDEDQKILRGLFKVKAPLEREAKILQFVKERLRLQNGWFLIFDNVQQFTHVQNHFPKDPEIWGEGRVILTTRDRTFGNNAYVDSQIVVGELNAGQQLALFTKIMNNGGHLSFTKGEQELAKKFLEQIPPFPLDVSVAAYYIKATNVSYKNYQENMLKYSTDFSKVQEKILQEAGDYTKTRYGIITLSLKELIDTDPLFQDLLLFISLIDSQHIQHQLLVRFKGNIAIDNFIYHLKKYSLLTNDSSSPHAENGIFSIHQSTRAIILAYLRKELNLKEHKDKVQYCARSLENFMKEAVDKEDFATMKSLYSHAEHLLLHGELLDEKTAHSLKGELGCIYYYLRYSTKAQELLTESLLNLKRCCRENHTKIARFLVYLGNVHRTLGDYEQAKKLFEQSIQIYTKYAPNAVGTARASGYLGAVYHSLGDFEQAKSFLERGLRIYKKHPPNHIGLAWSLAHLARVYGTLGEYDQAIRLFEQSVEIYKAQAEDYVGAGWVGGSLGEMYIRVGNYEKAQQILEESLEICRKHFPEDHVFMAEHFAHFAFFHAKQMNYAKAKVFLQKALAPIEETYGKDHVKTGNLLLWLGQIYAVEHDLLRAEASVNRSLAIFQKHKHPDQYLVLEGLSDIYYQRSLDAKKRGLLQGMGEFQSKADAFLKQALEFVNAHFPADSPHLIRLQDKVKKRELERTSYHPPSEGMVRREIILAPFFYERVCEHV